ncbi:CinA family protein [Streptomyces sp. S1]|uniref:CinA family protein n=1 Tax=Streptomyces sp. S1 TaxID=718288 RepID=UPI000EF7A1CB
MTEAARVLALLAERGQTLAVAESLTGGLVAAELTGVPGASASFRGSVTAYATALKHELLGVDEALLAERGAVDPEVASQMAAGVRARLGADWGIATTGVAGPDPQDGQPVGTVYVAVAGPAGTVAGPAGTVAGAAGEVAGSAGEASPTGSPAGSRAGSPTGKVVPLRLNGDRGEIRRESVRIVLALLHGELSGNARAQDTEQNGGN